ncbi:MAG: hypothetical protein K2I30_04545 [Clostridia bacterium]|nr:hypothetical protein [Clostridia bacterium]
MALGSLGLSDFKPKASKTAESLLTVIPIQEHKKDETIQLRVDYDVHQTFKEICDVHGKKMSVVLRAYIDSVISAGRL